MVFSSLYFIFVFLPLVCIVYYLLNLLFKEKIWIKNTFLLIASLFFYAWGEPCYILLMLLSITVNYYCALLFEKTEKSKMILVISVIFNLIFLIFFKYVPFFIQNINLLFGINLKVPSFTLPIGISFYTFQALSYVIDVYRKKVPAQKKYVNLALYICLFPQLIAGPIVRYIDIEKEINYRKETFDNFISGLKKFMVGLGAKVILANNLALFVDNNLNQELKEFANIPSLIIWLTAISYALQIYFDFSGYSLMAIGLGKMFGFNFPENFNHPYCAVSITDFWRRWHITLSTWFRDYVYIPLGGNRVKPLRHIFNILVTWMLTGFWHGANWNFFLWGLYYGILLIIEKYCISKIKFPKFFENTVLRMIALFCILFGWLIFRIENIAQFNEILKCMFKGISSGNLFMKYICEHADVCSKLIFLVPGIICSLPVYKIIFKNAETSKVVFTLETVFAFLVFIISVCMLVASTYNPFIYFRF